MQNTLSCSVRLIVSTLMLTVLSACGGGGSSNNDSPTPAPVEANTPPVLEAIGAQTVAETETLNFIVTATDAESTPELKVSDLPSGATFDPANGTFNWQPVVGDAANSPYSVTFTAEDEVDATLTATETIEITVTAVSVTADCSVGVTSPVAGSLQVAGDPGVQAATATLAVEATLDCTPNIPAGWGVKLALAGANNGSTGEEIVTTAPFINTFTGLSKDEYTLTASVVDSAGAAVSGAATEIVVNSVGLGDYYIAIGDSITFGVGDDEDTDNTSTDGRNSGGGYTPILNNLLTEALGYPHTVIAVGVEGTTSEEGITDVAGALAAHPGAQRVLVMYGMNDAGPPFRPDPGSVESGLGLNPGDAGYDNSFKDNMEQIVAAIESDGKEVVLAKINIARGDSAGSGRYLPIADIEQGARNVEIRDYNSVIEELIIDAGDRNSIRIAAPDFYTFFLTNERFTRQYFDNIHPNGVGYGNMANEWTNAIVPPASP